MLKEEVDAWELTEQKARRSRLAVHH